MECWGSNLFGQLGDGTTTPKTTPTPVIELHHGVKAISAGYDNTCALLTHGAVKCWGTNSFGGLGDGSIGGPEASCECAVKPVEVSGLQSGAKAISTGGYHSCALTNAGAVKCWGENDYTELGDGTNVNKGTPVEASGLSSGINAISAGGYHTCVVTIAHAAECLGDNAAGQLGNGTDAGPGRCVDGSACSWTPVEVIELRGVRAISASSGMHTCALTSAGKIKCWGENAYGELGDGTTSNRSAPVEVSGL